MPVHTHVPLSSYRNNMRQTHLHIHTDTDIDERALDVHRHNTYTHKHTHALIHLMMMNNVQQQNIGECHATTLGPCFVLMSSFSSKRVEK